MRKLIALAILLLGAGVFIWNVTPRNPRDGGNPSLTLSSGSVNSDQGLRYVRDSGAPAVGTQPLRPTPAENPGNLTDLLAQLYVSKVVAQNQGLPPRGGPMKVPPDTAIAEAIQEQVVQGFRYERLYTARDVRTIADASADAQLEYLTAFRAATAKNFAAIRKSIFDMVSDLATKQDDRALRAYVAAIPKQIDDLLTLRVPAPWSVFHIENLNLWEKKLEVYTALLNSADDPLKAYLALQELGSIDAENRSLQTLLNENVSDLGS